MWSIFRRKGAEPPAIEPVPAAFPKLEGAEIAAAFSAPRIGGDFYDSVRVSPERVLFGLLDVAGQRQENVGLLAIAQHIFRSAGPELFSKIDINESTAMTELSLRINGGLIQASKTVHSCPAFLGCYHEKFGTLCYTNAGHTPALLRDGKGIAELASTGLPLGLFSHAPSDAQIVGLEKGATLLLVSRGVVECGVERSESGEEFGLERVKEILRKIPPESAQELCASILNGARQHGANAPLCNDMTALSLLRTA
jgi:phosphoserine phosphatase RsbU/P